MYPALRSCFLGYSHDTLTRPKLWAISKLEALTAPSQIQIQRRRLKVRYFSGSHTADFAPSV